MAQRISWQGQPVAFKSGDTVATALLRAGIQSFGRSRTGGQLGVFCGIGQCQACLVVNQQGHVVEACLSPCVDGAAFSGVMGPGTDHV